MNQALAVRARALGTGDDAEEASSAAGELLRRWSAGGPQPAFEAFDLAVALDALGGFGKLEQVPGTTRWLAAARAYAQGEFVAAAAILADIGSQPDEAYALVQAPGADERRARAGLLPQREGVGLRTSVRSSGPSGSGRGWDRTPLELTAGRGRRHDRIIPFGRRAGGRPPVGCVT